MTTSATIAVTTPLIVSTLAGQPLTRGDSDGAGSAARFFYPSGIATDNAGNIYLADTDNHTIRKVVASTGAVTTLAGLAGNSGDADGTGSAARFNNPSGVAADSAGNVYVADTMNNTLRMVTPQGVVSTLAGSPETAGSADGTGSTARFQGPQGLAIDTSNNLYVADTNNHTIRKVVTSTGVVTTVAGLAGNSGSADGLGSQGRFNHPSGVAVDGTGNLYVADTENHTIRQILPSGMVNTVAGSAGNSGGADGTGSAARFDSPSDLAVDSSGNVYVADTDNFTIREVVPSTGAVTTLAGLAGTSGSADGLGSAVRFFHPAGHRGGQQQQSLCGRHRQPDRAGRTVGNQAHHPDTAAKPDGYCGQQRPVLRYRLRTSGGDVPVVLQRHGDQRRDGQLLQPVERSIEQRGELHGCRLQYHRQRHEQSSNTYRQCRDTAIWSQGWWCAQRLVLRRVVSACRRSRDSGLHEN